MPPSQKTFKIEISSRTIIFTVFFLLFLQLMWLVKELIFSFFIAFIVMSALNPLVSWLERRHVPRGLSALVLFVVIISGIAYLFTWIIPPVVQETTALVKNFPRYVRNLNALTNLDIRPDVFTRYIPNITDNALSILQGVFSNVVFLVSTVFFSFYFLVEESAIRKFFTRFFEKKQALIASAVIERAEQRMRRWFWGELVLMLVIGTFTFIGLSLVGVRFALPLALMAGLFEIAPVVGPVISAVPAFIVAFGDSYFLGLAVLALYFVIQQLENQVVVPFVMRRAVGLNPIITLAALIIGGKIGGVVGILLAIPVTLFVETVLIELSHGQPPKTAEASEEV